MMSMLVSAALLAVSVAAPATSDVSPFYRTYAQGTAESASRAAERPDAKDASTPHGDCVKCGCHKSQVDKGGSSEKK